MLIMRLRRRLLGVLLAGAAALVALSLRGRSMAAVEPPAGGSSQEQAPNRREFTLTVKNYRYAPGRIEVAQGDLVKLTVKSEDVDYSLTIDAYRVSRRVPAGGMTTIEFLADRAGTFEYYSNLTSDERHAETKGELVVRAR
jgi:plastocyanin domain-containing protein